MSGVEFIEKLLDLSTDQAGGAEDEDDEPVIEMHPGDYMAFYSPWDGDYDT